MSNVKEMKARNLIKTAVAFLNNKSVETERVIKLLPDLSFTVQSEKVYCNDKPVNFSGACLMSSMFGDQYNIMVNGDLMSSLSNEEQRFVIGHELGHFYDFKVNGNPSIFGTDSIHEQMRREMVADAFAYKYGSTTPFTNVKTLTKVMSVKNLMRHKNLHSGKPVNKITEKINIPCVSVTGMLIRGFGSMAKFKSMDINDYPVE